jgi:hypothetical protein
MSAKNFCIALLIAAFAPSVFTAQQVATTPVAISVKDPSGAGIPHALVRVVPAPDPNLKLETDSHGVVSLNLKPGGFALFVQCQGFRRVVNHFDVRQTKEVQTIPVVLQIEHGGGVEVVDAPSNNDLGIFAYPYHDPLALSPSALKAMPHISVTIHNSHSNADETYSGVRLADVLAKVGAPLGGELRGVALATYIIAVGSDGYQAVFSLAEVDPSFHPGEVIVADAMDGKPLDAHSGPLKLVVTEDKRPARSVRNLTTIKLESPPEPKHYN